MGIIVITTICFIFAFIFVAGFNLITDKIDAATVDEVNAEERLVDISLDISEQIAYFIVKHQMTPKEFCKKLKISDDVFLLWVSGVYDFKLSQLARIEALFNEHLIKTTLIDRKKIKPV